MLEDARDPVVEAAERGRVGGLARADELPLLDERREER
jgi:hypothetical protein